MQHTAYFKFHSTYLRFLKIYFNHRILETVLGEFSILLGHFHAKKGLFLVKKDIIDAYK